MSNTAVFTVVQVAFVLCEPVKTVKKAFDEGLSERVWSRKGATSRGGGPLR